MTNTLTPFKYLVFCVDEINEIKYDKQKIEKYKCCQIDFHDTRNFPLKIAAIGLSIVFLLAAFRIIVLNSTRSFFFHLAFLVLAQFLLFAFPVLEKYFWDTQLVIQQFVWR